ncbi:hypothetical protein [Spirosoma spitsbergense]|nr:hypothetical protein [Spirosoma spitsbergense]
MGEYTPIYIGCPSCRLVMVVDTAIAIGGQPKNGELCTLAQLMQNPRW